MEETLYPAFSILLVDDESAWLRTMTIHKSIDHIRRQKDTVDIDEVGQEQSLLICCSAFKADPKQFPNLTIKKIPKAVLKKCEWGHDDYSLEIKNLPDAPEIEKIITQEPEEKEKKTAIRKFGKGKARQKQLSLFDSGGEE